MTNQTIMDRFYTPEEIAEKLKVHSQTILAYIRSGKLKAIKLEKRFRIAEADFQNFIKSSSNRPSTPEDHLIQVSVERRYSVLRKMLMRPVTPLTEPIPNHKLETMLEKAIVRSNQGFRAFPMPTLSLSQEKKEAWADGLLIEKRLDFAGDLYFFAFASVRGDVLTAENLWEDNEISVFKNSIGLVTSIGNMYRGLLFISRYYSQIDNVKDVDFQFIIDNPAGRKLVMDTEKQGFFWNEGYIATTEEPIIIEKKIKIDMKPEETKGILLDMTKNFLWYFNCPLDEINLNIVNKRIEEVISNVAS